MEDGSKQDWDEYYRVFERKRCRTPMYNIGLYETIANGCLREIFSADQPLNILVGGVAGIISAGDYYLLLSNLRPGKKDNLIFTDQNILPLQKIKRGIPCSSVIQGKLESLPVVPKSIDLVILDYTLYFMNNRQVGEFMEKVKEVLSENGIVICVIDREYEEKQKNVFGIKTYPRPPEFYYREIEKNFNAYLVVYDPEMPNRSNETLALVFGNRGIKQSKSSL